MVRWLRDNIEVKDCIIVSPDAGGAKRYVRLVVKKRSTLHQRDV